MNNMIEATVYIVLISLLMVISHSSACVKTEKMTLNSQNIGTFLDEIDACHIKTVNQYFNAMWETSMDVFNEKKRAQKVAAENKLSSELETIKKKLDKMTIEGNLDYAQQERLDYYRSKPINGGNVKGAMDKVKRLKNELDRYFNAIPKFQQKKEQKMLDAFGSLTKKLIFNIKSTLDTALRSVLDETLWLNWGRSLGTELDPKTMSEEEFYKQYKDKFSKYVQASNDLRQRQTNGKSRDYSETFREVMKPLDTFKLAETALAQTKNLFENYGRFQRLLGQGALSDPKLEKRIKKLNISIALRAKGITPEKMLKLTEKFFVNAGLQKMTAKFWENSDVSSRPGKSCSSFAANMMDKDDFRLSMCAKQTLDDWSTMHHEMGHIQYYMAYQKLPLSLRKEPNPAFTEAIGDAIQVSATSLENLKRVGLVSQVPNDQLSYAVLQLFTIDDDINMVKFFVQEEWRRLVYQEKVNISEYNLAYLILRDLNGIGGYEYDGRGTDFIMGHVHHIVAGETIFKYLFATLLKYMIHKRLCTEIGQKELHKCNIARNKKAGQLFRKFLSQGKSKPWNVQLKEFLGTSDITADAMLEYYQPLQKYLDNVFGLYQNKPTGRAIKKPEPSSNGEDDLLKNLIDLTDNNCPDCD